MSSKKATNLPIGGPFDLTMSEEVLKWVNLRYICCE
jgi:hypothetical protein